MPNAQHRSALAERVHMSQWVICACVKLQIENPVYGPNSSRQRPPEASPWNLWSLCESDLENHCARKRQPPFDTFLSQPEHQINHTPIYL